jgi:hypothetical protein
MSLMMFFFKAEFHVGVLVLCFLFQDGNLSVAGSESDCCALKSESESESDLLYFDLGRNLSQIVATSICVFYFFLFVI